MADDLRCTCGRVLLTAEHLRLLEEHNTYMGELGEAFRRFGEKLRETAQAIPLDERHTSRNPPPPPEDDGGIQRRGGL